MKLAKQWLVVLVLALAAPLAFSGALAAVEKVARWEKGCGLTEPKVVEKVAPAYPEDARAEKVQGVVVLEVTIAAKGDVTDIEAIEDPDARLTAAARDAVVHWRFEPARDEKGKATAVRYRLTVAFKLQ